MSHIVIRDAQPNDLPAIASISNHYRLHTTHIWDRKLLSSSDLVSWLDIHRQPPYTAIVAELDGLVIGYASLSRFRPHTAYDVTAEDSIYLAPEYAGKGYGAALMDALLARAKQNGLHNVTAWIDSTNIASVRFHEKFGFGYVGTMPHVGLLNGQKTSVIIMVKSLIDR